MTVADVTLAKNSPTILGSVARGTFKVAQALTLGFSGVLCMTGGVYLANLTTVKVNQFYFEKEDKAAGYGDIPGFANGCEWLSNFSNEKFGFPQKDSLFCKNISTKPFAKQEGLDGPASLAASLALTSSSYLLSLYLVIGGFTLIGRSFEIITS